MKSTTSIAELKKHLLQKRKQRRIGKPGRTPIDGLDAHKVAGDYLDIPKAKVVRR